ELDFDDFNMASVAGADRFIARVARLPATIARRDALYTFQQFQGRFCAPKASAAKNSRLGLLVHALLRSGGKLKNPGGQVARILLGCVALRRHRDRAPTFLASLSDGSDQFLLRVLQVCIFG